MSAIGIPVGAFGAVLCVLWLAAIVTESRFMTRTALALFANWAAHMLWWSIGHDPSPWAFSMIADALTAFVILRRPSGGLQAAVGTTLMIQIIVSGAYGVHMLTRGYSNHGEDAYWAWLDWIALGQILLLGTWWIDGLGRYLLGWRDRRLLRSYGGIAPSDDPAGVARP